MRRDMHTDQALFPLEVEPGISWVRLWKELFATEAHATWLFDADFVFI